MKGNKLLSTIFDTAEKKLRWRSFVSCSKGHAYKQLRDSGDSGEPSCLQRTLDLIDFTFSFDPVGARQIAALPLEHHRSLVATRAVSKLPFDEFENAFRGLQDAMEAGASLTNAKCSIADRKRQMSKVLLWAEENLARLNEIERTDSVRSQFQMVTNEVLRCQYADLKT
jgi:hypothetical protein